MSTQRKSLTARLNRALAIGAVAGAAAVGFGALSSVNAPMAQADWWAWMNGDTNTNDNGKGNAIGNGNLSGNNVVVGAQNGNGNAQQQTWGSGNVANNQLN
ncbi:hypothetical protein ABQF34_30335, partial [Mycolicibacterium boenickei]